MSRLPIKDIRFLLPKNTTGIVPRSPGNDRVVSRLQIVKLKHHPLHLRRQNQNALQLLGGSFKRLLNVQHFLATE